MKTWTKRVGLSLTENVAVAQKIKAIAAGPSSMQIKMEAIQSELAIACREHLQGLRVKGVTVITQTSTDVMLEFTVEYEEDTSLPKMAVDWARLVDYMLPTDAQMQLMYREIYATPPPTMSRCIDGRILDDLEDEPSPTHSLSEEETNMGFTRTKRGGTAIPRNRNLPPKVQDADFSQIHKYHQYILADALGCFGAVKAAAQADRATILKERALQNLATGQRYYELICLQKDGGKPAETDEEKRYVELLGNILNQYSGDLDKAGDEAVSKAIEALDKGVEKHLPKMIDFAKKAIAEAADKRAPIVIKDGGKVRKIKGVLPPEFQRMVELASARIPIMLVGPAGCGKTFLAEKVAEALDLEYSDQSCSEGMSESVFNGRLLPIGKGGAFEHVPSLYMQRYETGGVMLLDEIDAGDPNLFTYINKSIANTSYTVDQRWTKPVVKKHKDFALIAAANTYGNGADAMYVGRNQLDAATLDRFKVGMITMDYCKEVEESMAPQEVCEWAWGVREKIRENKLRRVMSTRVIKDLGTMTERYNWARPEWERSYFTGWSEADRRLVA